MEESLEIKKKDKLMIFTFASLAFALVSSISYMIYVIATSGSFINHVISIISVVLLVVFSIILVVAGFFIENKKAKIFISAASIILALYSIFGLITDIINNKDRVPNFIGVDIEEVMDWADERDIKLNQKLAFSDTVDAGYVMKQNVKEGTAVKNIKSLTVTVSKGLDLDKKAEVTNMVGWDLDKVIKFIDKNHLTNVTILFQFDNIVARDKIISQDVIKEVKRDDPITLVSSLGKESDFPDVKVESIIGLDSFHAKVYCGRNNIKYKIEYAYSKDKEDVVLKQSIKKWTIIGPKENKEMILTISSKEKVTIPDLTKMTKDELLEWASNSHMRIDFKEEYDDNVKEGKVISANYDKGTDIKTDTVINVVISKGQIKMIEFTDIDAFRKWAEEKDVAYNINYEYSDDVDTGKVISISHRKGDVIKNTDTVEILISYGGTTTVPNLIGLSKDNAKSECNSAHVKCSFTGDGDTVSKQSMAPDSTVPTGTTITVTLN